jgi:hypothetical protein
MIHQRWLLLGAAMGISAACGGSEFTSLEDGGASPGTGGGGTSSVVTTGGAGGGTGGSTETTSVSTTTAGGAAGATGGHGGGTGGVAGSGGRATGAGGASGGAGGRSSTSSTGGSGGSFTSSTGGAGGSPTTTTQGTGGMPTTTTGGMGGSGTGGVPDASTDPCPALRMDVDAKLAAAQKCDPNAPVKECGDLVDGICCHQLPVASAMSNATLAYLAALDKYNAQQCFTVCTLLCRMGTGYCAPNPDTGGICALGPSPPPPAK